ncbi:MAG: GSCFA domain-containing protein [Tenacibaculum sp.]
MILHTQLALKSEKYSTINYNSKLCLIGSCFSKNMATKFLYYKFQCFQNPFGILFHPKAIENLISRAVNKKPYIKKDIFYHNELWHSFDAHLQLSSQSEKELLNKLNTAVKSTLKQLKNTTHFIVTLGTAWVYILLKNKCIVANCHKLSQKKFLKQILSVEQIKQSLNAINTLVKSINKEICIVYTISPVRHLKDGFVENQQSKAHLITAIHQTINKANNINYFPSYEIMMDELRDYRFYAEDMIHPNTMAVNYIWEKFKQVWVSEDAQELMLKVESIQKELTHQPFNPDTELHKKFLKKLALKQTALKKQHPFISF